jgi:hypothetical protein
VLHPAALDESRGYCRYLWDTGPERVAVVEGLAEERARLLRSAGTYPDRWAEDLAGGRLLAYDPDGNLFDGAAEESSGGFFDVDNIPPWDTWICYAGERNASTWKPFDSYLISWVPPSFLDLAEQGIWINPEECIVWAGQLEAYFIDQLRAAGLLPPE